MDELFPVEQVTMDSPKLAWTKTHSVITMSFPPEMCYGEWDKWLAGIAPGVEGKDAIAQWFCDETSNNELLTIGHGDTEDNALLDLCAKHGLKHWNLA